MRLYDIVLMLFVFGAASQAINAIGGFSMQIPASTPAITQAQVSDVTQNSPSPLNFFFIYQIIVAVGSVIVMGAITVLSILPLFLSWTGAFGISPLVAVPVGMIVQIPIWWVMINGYYQMTTGHAYKVME